MSVKVITRPPSYEELIAIASEQEFEGLLVVGIREPDPLMCVCILRNSYPGEALPIAILHSGTELAGLSLPLAARALREIEPPRHPPSSAKRTILIDQPGRQLVVDGKQQNVSPGEFRLILFLIRYPGIVFSREELLHRTGSSKRTVSSRIIDVLIGRLRLKIDNGSAPSHLTTVHGIGYRFLRRDAAFIDGFTRRTFESWPCCPNPGVNAPNNNLFTLGS